MKNLYVDPLLGFIFGAVVGGVFMERNSIVNKNLFFWLTVVIAVLPILKSSGFFLACYSLFTCFLLLAMRTCYKIHNFELKIQRRKVFLWFGCCLGSILLVNYSWKFYIKSQQFSITFKTQMTSSEIFNKIKNPNQDDQLITTSFFKALLKNNIGPGREMSANRYVNFFRKPVMNSFFTWSSIMFVLSVFGIIMASYFTTKCEIFLIQTVLFIGSILYASGLLVLYLFSFSKYEAVNLASMNRYLATYILGWLWVSLTPFLVEKSNLNKKLLISPVVTIAIFFSLILPRNALVFFQETPEMISERYALHATETGFLNKFKGRGKSLFLIFHQTTGFEYRMAAYFLEQSFSLNQGCYSIKLYQDDPVDVWSCIRSLDQISTLLKDYDFILVGKNKDKFLLQYSLLFEINPTKEKNENWMIFQKQFKNENLKFVQVF